MLSHDQLSWEQVELVLPGVDNELKGDGVARGVASKSFLPALTVS